MEATVALLDLLRIILSVMLDDLAACPHGPRLATEAERTFAVLDAPTPASSTNPPVPFLNQTMLADYQHAYSLRQLLSNALKHAQGTCLKTGYCHSMHILQMITPALVPSRSSCDHQAFNQAPITPGRVTAPAHATRPNSLMTQSLYQMAVGKANRAQHHPTSTSPTKTSRSSQPRSQTPCPIHQFNT